jgi:hypothetical protein
MIISSSSKAKHPLSDNFSILEFSNIKENMPFVNLRQLSAIIAFRDVFFSKNDLNPSSVIFKLLIIDKKDSFANFPICFKH